MNLDGRVALITGGARIGATVALALAGRGCAVAMTYRTSRMAVDDTVRRIIDGGGRAISLRCDATLERDVRRAVADTARRLGSLDVLVNMASTYEKTPLKRLTRKQWDDALASNLTATHLFVQNAKKFLSKGKGRVVNFADWVAASGRPRYKDFLPYYAAKAGVVGLTEAQALELAPAVLVNAIAPGPILPPKSITNEEVRNVSKVTPLGRWGGPEEIARAVLFLCETDFITGECLRVDGGRHLL